MELKTKERQITYDTKSIQSEKQKGNCEQKFEKGGKKCPRTISTSVSVVNCPPPFFNSFLKLKQVYVSIQTKVSYEPLSLTSLYLCSIKSSF